MTEHHYLITSYKPMINWLSWSTALRFYIPLNTK